MTELTIGEFSKAIGLTIKALRFYHERGILIPVRVDAGSGYRYYDESNFDSAKQILALRDLGFSIEEVKQILEQSEMTLDFLRQRKQAVKDDIVSQNETLRKLELAIADEKRKQESTTQNVFAIEIRQLEPMLVAGIRMQGRYAEMSSAFQRMSKAMGQFVAGPSQCLYFDEDYREENANFEPQIQIRTLTECEKVEGISIRELPGGKAICLKHAGSYQSIGSSYAKLFAYANANGHTRELPSREVYVKGPDAGGGRAPEEYLTEIQFLIAN